MEKAEDWEVHRARVLGSLSPVGYLEETLTERVALLLWRVARAARYEREVIALQQEEVEEILTDKRLRDPLVEEEEYHPQAVRDNLCLAREKLRLLKHFSSMADKVPLLKEDAAAVLWAVNKAAQKVDLEEDDIDPPGVSEDFCLKDFPSWTARLVRQEIAAIATREGMNPGELLAITIEMADLEVRAKSFEVERVSRELDRLRRERLLPEGKTQEKISRYEAHLERSFYKALHELQRLQALRAGQPVPPPVVLDVTVSSDGSGFVS